MEWIKVKDKLPKHGVIVNVCGGDIERYGLRPTAGYYIEQYNCFSVILEEDELELCNPEYWMEIPDEPSKKGGTYVGKSAFDWPECEDGVSSTGIYEHECRTCGRIFFGNKSRRTCYQCAWTEVA